MGLLSLLGLAPAEEPLALGTPVPSVRVPDETGAMVDVAELCARGLTLVYFYPMPSTPGCTAQACSLRDEIGTLEGLGLQVLGVSRAGPSAQKRFRERQHLPFRLLADAEGRVIRAFGVGTVAFGIPRRQSFLIREGQIVWRTLSAHTRHHAAEVREALSRLPTA